MSSITWLGHSTALVELDGTRFLTDPVLERRIAHLVRARAVPRDALGRVDAVLVSHTHFDHLDLSSLRRVDRSAEVVVPRGAGGMIRRRRFSRVHEVSAGESLRLGGVPVDVVHADHGVVRRHLRTSSAVGFVLRGTPSIYFAGDTDLFDGMRELGRIDVALLPISGWGPRVPAGHLDPARAAEALRLVQPSLVVPVHWGTFRTPRAPEPSRAVAEAFASAAAEAAPEVEVRVLEIGETLEL